jgi:hypothetical protein
MGLTTCLIHAASTTIIFDNGAKITVPRKWGDPPEETARSISRLLCVDQFYIAPASG